jgi:hypothetical protein
VCLHGRSLVIAVIKTKSSLTSNAVEDLPGGRTRGALLCPVLG